MSQSQDLSLEVKEQNQGMTVNEIADVCGVNEKTIRMWIENSSDKMSKQKLMDAKSTHQKARFSEDEVYMIVASGGNKTQMAKLLEEKWSQSKEIVPIHKENQVKSGNSKGMTMDEIADVVGVSRTSIVAWIQKSNLSETDKQNYHDKNKYPIEDVIEIVKAGGRESMARLLQDNANITKKATEYSSDPILIINEQCKQLREKQLDLEKRMSEVEKRVESKLIPQQLNISDRKRVVMAVNECVKRSRLSHEEIYGIVYARLSVYVGKKIVYQAKKAGISKLNYVENNNWLPEMIAIISEL